MALGCNRFEEVVNGQSVSHLNESWLAHISHLSERAEPWEPSLFLSSKAWPKTTKSHNYFCLLGLHLHGRDVMRIALSNKRLGVPAVLILVLAVTFGTVPLSAQENRPFTKTYDKSYPNQDYDHTRAVPLEHSRAEQEADRLVSLSADKIVSLLTAEPGLLLVCKKVLVRNAFAQGRVLTLDELSDDAVLRLVRDDQEVRILFTREIQDRYYVRAKPTREELENDWERGRIRVPDAAELQAEGTANANNAKNQEEGYWLRHERDLDRTGLVDQKAGQNGSAPTEQAMPPYYQLYPPDYVQQSDPRG